MWSFHMNGNSKYRRIALSRSLFMAGVTSVLFALIWIGAGDTLTISLLGLLLCAAGFFRRSAQVDFRIFIPFSLYILTGMLSAFNIYRNPAAGYYVPRQLIFPVLYLLTATLERRQLSLLKQLCILFAALMSAAGIGQFVFYAVVHNQAGRMGGLLGNPNAMGIFAAAGWFALSHCMEEQADGKGLLFRFLPCAEPVFLIALAMTLSMGSFVAMAAGILVVFIRKKRLTSYRQAFFSVCPILARASLGIGTGLLLYIAAVRTGAPWSCLILLAYAAALVLCWKQFLLFLEASPKAALFIASGGFFVAALMILSRPSAVETFTERLEMMGNGIRYLLRYPILGVGPGQWRIQNLYGGEKYFNTWYIHNALIHTGAELGITAMALVILTWVRIFKKHKAPWARAGITAFFVHNMLDTGFFHTGIMTLLVTTLGEPRLQGRKLGSQAVKLLFGTLALIFLGCLYLYTLI